MQDGFVPNRGQWPDVVRFVANRGGLSMFAHDDGWTIRVRGDERAAAVRMRFEGVEAVGSPGGERRLPGLNSVFRGSDPRRWCTDLPRFAELSYQGVYDGIDVRLHAGRGVFEYDLLLASGAELARVEIAVEGADRLRLEPDGALVLDTPAGPVRQPAPRTWEITEDGSLRMVECRYVLRGGDRFGFEAPGWDRRRPLVVDPQVVYATYLGGSWDDRIYDIAVADDGVVTLVGLTSSADFPSTPGGLSQRAGWDDVFVVQLDPRRAGPAQLLYAALFGGAWDESFGGWIPPYDVDPLSVDDSGIVTITGSTDSPDFPVTPNALQSSLRGFTDAFVIQLDPSQVGLAQIRYSTLLGGDDHDGPAALVTDPVSGVISVVGTTTSTDFPTTVGAYQTWLRPNCLDIFVARIDPSRAGSQQLSYGTYFGSSSCPTGFDGEYPRAIGVDSAGVVTLAGATTSPGFPTTANALNSFGFTGGVFVSRLDPSRTGAQQLVYSTQVGNNADCDCAAIDARGNVWLAGSNLGPTSPSGPSNVPVTAGAYDPIHVDRDAFVVGVSFDANGVGRVSYGTYLGDVGDESAHSIVVDRSGIVAVSVAIFSSAFPVTPGAYFTSATSGSAIAVLDPSRTGAAQLLYSTHFPEDQAVRAFDPSGSVWLSGWGGDQSTLPISANAFDPTHNGRTDGWVGQLSLLPTGADRYGDSTPGCDGKLPIRVTSMPAVGNSGFAVFCSEAPPSGRGVCLAGTGRRSSPLRLLGVDLWIDPFAPILVSIPVSADARGIGELPLAIPGAPGIQGLQVFTQFLWADACASAGISASWPLQITVQ